MFDWFISLIYYVFIFLGMLDFWFLNLLSITFYLKYAFEVFLSILYNLYYIYTYIYI